MEEISNLEIKFSDFWDAQTFQDVLWTGIPEDVIASLLKAFYAFKIWVYVNDGDYESIRKLEGILELHNLIKGKTDKI